jgi:dihydrofolate synthase/folylpolyglutamate synthase
MLQALGNPQRSFQAVHVTGSKGKGTVSALIAAGLRASGARTGVYGSPHVERVNERVRVANNEPIGDGELANALETALAAREKFSGGATWFDVMTVAGMVSLHTAGVDWAVVEVGMGGRLDSTNVLNAPVTVVTNIALEHEDIIGPTLRDIACEKAGIFSRGCRPIVGMSEADELAPIFADEARIVGAERPVFVAPKPDESLRSRNAAIARNALQAALPSHGAFDLLSEETIDMTLKSLPARLERVSVRVSGIREGRDQATDRSQEVVMVILDGAHTPESVERVLFDVCSGSGNGLVILIGLSLGKDVARIFKHLARVSPVEVVVTTIGREQRYLPAAELQASALSAGINNVRGCDDPAAALDVALRKSRDAGATLLVLGSLHLAGVVRPLLRRASIAAEDEGQPPAGEQGLRSER